MVSMFDKYDNLDPNYVPINTYWPTAPDYIPSARLLTPKFSFGDTVLIKFQINKDLAEVYKNDGLSLTIYNFRGEVVYRTSQNLTDEIMKFKVISVSPLPESVYYIHLAIVSGKGTFTIYDRRTPCLTIA